MDTATLIGRKCNLAAEFRGFTPDTVWEVKNATSVGGKVILAVNNGSKGLAAPVEMFVLQDAEPVAPAPKPRATKFKMDGAEKDSPLYEVFQRCAPDDELSRELYVMYQSEYSEFDTDFLGTLAGQVNATLVGKWTKEQVGEMLQLLNATYDDTAWRVPLPSGAELVEGPVVETVPEPEPIEQPAIRAVTDEILASTLDNLPPAPVVPQPETKRRGRPAGSRNRPKLDVALTMLRDEAEGRLVRTPVNQTKELAQKLALSTVAPELVAVSLKLATAIAEAAAATGSDFPEVLDHAFGIVENLF